MERLSMAVIDGEIHVRSMTLLETLALMQNGLYAAIVPKRVFSWRHLSYRVKDVVVGYFIIVDSNEKDERLIQTRSHKDHHNLISEFEGLCAYFTETEVTIRGDKFYRRYVPVNSQKGKEVFDAKLKSILQNVRYIGEETDG